MFRFNYTVILESDERVSGTLRTRDRREALTKIGERNFHPLTLVATDQPPGHLARIARNLFRRITTSDLRVLRGS